MATQAATPSSSSALASSSTALLARLHPSLYLSNHLAHSSRPASSASSTKAPLDAPAVDVNLSPLTASSSRQPPGVPSPSALARWGSTTVICNITPTIVYPDAVQGSAATTTSSQSASTIVPSISLTPLSSPSSDFKSGPPSEYAQHIAERLFAFLDAGLPFDKSVLNIATDGDDEDSRVRAKWCLFADCSVIGFDGGLLEASFLAIVAALRQLHLPKAHFSLDDSDVIASPEPSDYWRLRDHMTRIPLAFGFGIYDGHLLTTPSSFESSLVSTSILVGLAFDAATTASSKSSPPRVTAVDSTGPLSETTVADVVVEDEELLEACVQLASRTGERVVKMIIAKEAEMPKAGA